ncbi:MAG: VWA-like domain-containing protein [Clostridiales bacterium]|nr:VWA-like domain-containing protein [Clostridiales bacterium]
MTTTTPTRAATIARDILLLSRNTLLVKLRFMDAALCELTLEQSPTTLSTDGRRLHYGLEYVLGAYKREKEAVVRDYLHIVMHCIFRHLFVSTLVNQACWDLACDIAVESAISELNIKAADSARARAQAAAIIKLKGKVNMLTAEKLYRYFLDENYTDGQVAALRQSFLADDHMPWYLRFAGASVDGGDGDVDSGGAVALRGAAEARWTELSERAKTDMETFSRQHGDNAGSMTQNLAEVTRERYDYADFLQKFAVQGEVMQTSDDEFDYIFYTYGLKLYGNVPLIEPLEYKEVKRVKEFIIAIDTSGSVSGELAQKFLNKTYNILQGSESFFTKVNVHIIQCDAGIQEDAKITSREEFDAYLKTMKIRGLGGTDFRPVFEYTDKLIKNKEFANLKGMIFFTDGYGTFPARKPDYEAAFVFVDDEYKVPEVPVWAIKLVLGKDEI